MIKVSILSGISHAEAATKQKSATQTGTTNPTKHKLTPKEHLERQNIKLSGKCENGYKVFFALCTPRACKNVLLSAPRIQCEMQLFYDVINDSDNIDNESEITYVPIAFQRNARYSTRTISSTLIKEPAMM